MVRNGAGLGYSSTAQVEYTTADMSLVPTRRERERVGQEQYSFTGSTRASLDFELTSALATPGRAACCRFAHSMEGGRRRGKSSLLSRTGWRERTDSVYSEAG